MWIEVVVLEGRKWKEARSRYYMNAIGRSAQTYEGGAHFPFSGGVEKGQFLAGLNISRGDDAHFSCIQNGVGIAGMIHGRQLSDLYMAVAADLDGELAGMVVNCLGRDGADDFPFDVSAAGDQAAIVVLSLDNQMSGEAHFSRPFLNWIVKG